MKLILMLSAFLALTAARPQGKLPGLEDAAADQTDGSFTTPVAVATEDSDTKATDDGEVPQPDKSEDQENDDDDEGSTTTTPSQDDDGNSTMTTEASTTTNSTADPPITTTSESDANSTTPTTTPPSTNSTEAPSPSPSSSPTPSTTTTSAVPEPKSGSSFDGWSFFGGILLTVGLLSVSFVGFRYYKARSGSGLSYNRF